MWKYIYIKEANKVGDGGGLDGVKDLKSFYLYF